jgi:cell division protease FtsH
MNQQKKSNYRRPNRPDKRDLLKKRNPMGAPQNNPSGKGKKKAWPLGHRIAFIIFLVILGLFLWKQMNPENANRVEISYSEFSGLLAADSIKAVKIHNSTLDGILKESMTLGREGAKRVVSNITVNIGTYDQTFIKDMVAQNIEVTIIPEKTWMTMLVSLLPWILILGVWLFILRQMQGGPKGVFSFGKSKAKLMEDHQQKVTFDDVAGVEEAKVELEEIIEFLKYPKKFQVLGGKIPKGALLVGPPGTGKTLLARAVAGEAGVPFFSMSGSDFVEMFVGVGASRVRDLFEQGKTSAPCILFIDEIDAVGRQRGAGIGGGHDEREQTLNQLLVEMDGFESNEGVILLAATNRPDVLDPALLRPGRFDRQIVVDWPDVKARKEILKVHTKNIKVGRNINLGNIAKGTPGMTGADLASVVNEAALLAARLNHRQVLMVDFEEAKDKVMMGSARKSLIITDEEKKLTACHEAGHVLVSKFVVGADPVHKVSIIARGRALGLTHFLPVDEKHSWSYSYCVGKLTVLLGGRAAEMIKFNDMTNGAANDIENATKMARKMVCEWGMSKRIGPLSFGKKESEVFLGRDIATHKDYSEETAVAIDQEIRKIIDAAQQHAEKILRENTDKLDKLTDELLKQEILADYQIEQVLNGTTVSENKRSPRRRRRKPASQRQRTNASSGEDKKTSTDQATGNAAADNKKTVDSFPAKSVKSAKPDKAVKADSSVKQEKPEAKKENGKNDKIDKADKNGNSDKPDKSDKSDKTDKNDSKDKKGPGKKSGRSRMIRLKIGGRRRVIKKAPAQKIRKIN